MKRHPVGMAAVLALLAFAPATNVHAQSASAGSVLHTAPTCEQFKAAFIEGAAMYYDDAPRTLMPETISIHQVPQICGTIPRSLRAPLPPC
jgi:hypothetical protein